MKEHDELKDAYNIVYLELDPIGTVRFYSLNGNSEQVYGVDDKLIMNGFPETSLLNRADIIKLSLLNLGITIWILMIHLIRE